jgi:hypothetical protein
MSAHLARFLTQDFETRSKAQAGRGIVVVKENFEVERRRAFIRTIRLCHPYKLPKGQVGGLA